MRVRGPLTEFPPLQFRDLVEGHGIAVNAVERAAALLVDAADFHGAFTYRFCVDCC
jgi:hypothetical protein